MSEERSKILESIADEVENLIYDAVGVDENSINQEQYYVSAEIVNKLVNLMTQLVDA